MARLTRIAATAALWAALNYVAGKQGDRDALPAGAALPCDLSITGRIGSLEINEAVAGQLTVDHDSEVSSSVTPSATLLLAALFEFCGDDDLVVNFRDFVETNLDEGELASIPASRIKDAEEWLKSLRRDGPKKPRKGAVKFLAAA